MKGNDVIDGNQTLVNGQINLAEVRVIDDQGTQLGVMNSNRAQDIAQSKKLDLVLVAPNAKPPVCKIINWGKYQYQAKKKAKAIKANQTVIEVKEIQLRPVTDQHDLETKIRQAQKFIDQGKKVKFHMKFKGREAAHSEIGMDIMINIPTQIENCEVEKSPVLQGLNIFMILSPENK